MEPTVYTNGLKLQSVVQNEQNENVLNFPKGWIAADSSSQRNGTRQDVATMNIDSYQKNPVFLKDHVQETDHIIGRVLGLRKEGNKLVFDGVEFAPTPAAQEAKALVLGGFVKDVSTGLLAYADENDVYRDAELLEISLVVVGNNLKARLNQVTPTTMDEVIPTVEETVEEVVVEETAVEAAAEAAPVENSVEARIAELELKLNKAAAPKAVARVQEKFDHKVHFINQIRAYATSNSAELAKLNRVSAAQSGVVVNAIDVTTGASLLPTAEVQADIERCVKEYGVMVPEVDLRNMTELRTITLPIRGTELQFVNNASFCAPIAGSTPTYTNINLNPAKAMLATVLCQYVDLASPANIYQDVIDQIGQARARFLDQMIVTNVIAAAAASPIATATFADVRKDSRAMQKLTCGTGQEGIYVMKNSTWVDIQGILEANSGFNMDVERKQIAGKRVVTVDDTLTGLATGFITGTTSVLFGAFKNYRHYDFASLNIKVHDTGIVDGVNLAESESLGMVASFYHAGAVVQGGAFKKATRTA